VKIKEEKRRKHDLLFNIGGMFRKITKFKAIFKNIQSTFAGSN